jgi:putative endonuclease
MGFTWGALRRSKDRRRRVCVFHVYILASKPRGTLYTGVTGSLGRRVHEHKTHAVPGFTSRYGVDRLVWFDGHDTAQSAILREKRIKKWRRDWKVRLIEETNPHWADLYALVAS